MESKSNLAGLKERKSNLVGLKESQSNLTFLWKIKSNMRYGKFRIWNMCNLLSRYLYFRFFFPIWNQRETRNTLVTRQKKNENKDKEEANYTYSIF